MSIGAAERRREPAGGHGAGHAHFTLTSNLRPADGGILLVKDADGGRSEEEAHHAFMIGIGNKAVIVEGHGRNHSGSAIGGRGDHTPARGVLFIHRHGVDGDPVEWGQRLVAQPVSFLLPQAGGQAMRAAADIEATGQNAFRFDAPLDAALHDEPQAVDARTYKLDRRLLRIVWDESAFVLKHELADGELVGVRRSQQLCRAVKGKRD